MIHFRNNKKSSDVNLNIINKKNCYLCFMKIGTLLGGQETETRRQMQQVIEFETKLAEITTPQEDRRDEEKLYNLMTVGELQKLAPFVSKIIV